MSRYQLVLAGRPLPQLRRQVERADQVRPLRTRLPVGSVQPGRGPLPHPRRQLSRQEIDQGGPVRGDGGVLSGRLDHLGVGQEQQVLQGQLGRADDPAARRRQYACHAGRRQLPHVPPRRGDHLDVFHPNIAQVRGHEFGGTENVCLVLGQRTDAGDTQQFFQFTQKPLLVFAGVDNGGGRIQMRRS